MPRLLGILLPLLCAVALFSRCGSNTIAGNTGGGASEVVGKLVDKNGAPVDSAIVRLVPKSTDTLGNVFALDSVATDDTGHYAFDGPAAGDYVAYGVFGDSALIVSIPQFHYDSTVLKIKNLGIDTMLAPGKISGKVIADTTDLNGIRCYVPGTSFIAYTNGVGAFVMTGILPGTYTVRFEFTGYLPDSVAGVVVASGDTTRLSLVTLKYDPKLAPPRPTGLDLAYDTATGVVTLAWDPVKVSDLAGYKALQALENANFDTVTATLVTGTTCRDTVFDDLTDTNSFVRTYQVIAIDKNGDASLKSDPETIPAASPMLVRTVFDSCKVLGKGIVVDPDSVDITDSFAIVVHFRNATRTNVWLEWAIDSPNAVAKVTDLTLRPVKSGYDTLRYSWNVAGAHNLYLRASDGAGSVWTHSFGVTVVGEVVPRNAWVTVDSLDAGRKSPAVCALNGKVYAMGGAWIRRDRNREETLKTLEVFDPSTGVWTSLASAPTGRKWHCMAAALGRIYVFGGQQSSTGDLASIDEYNPSTNTWRTLSGQMPDSLVMASAATVDQKIYLVGGSVSRNAQTEILGDIWEFDPANEGWTNRGALQTPRAAHQVAAYNGLLIVAGGISADNATLGTVEVFNPSSSGSTAALASLRTPRSSFGLVALHDRVYAIGGLGSDRTVVQSVESVAPASHDAWQTDTTMTRARREIGCVELDGRAYVIGGTFDNGPMLSAYEVKLVEVYYP